MHVGFQRFGIGGGNQHDKFVAAHSRQIILFAAISSERRRDFLQNNIALKMALLVVYPFEAVQVAQEYSKTGVQTAATGNFRVQMNVQGSGVRKAGQIIGHGVILRLIEPHTVTQGRGQPRPKRLKYAQMVPAERVVHAGIKGENADCAALFLEWNGQRRLEVCEQRRVVEVPRLDGRVAVNYG